MYTNNIKRDFLTLTYYQKMVSTRVFHVIFLLLKICSNLKNLKTKYDAKYVSRNIAIFFPAMLKMNFPDDT